MRCNNIVFLIISLFTFIVSPGLAGADVIIACKNDQSGVLRMVNDIDECKNDESPLSWNTEGPQEKSGKPGSPGPPARPSGFDLSSSKLSPVMMNPNVNVGTEVERTQSQLPE